MHKRICGKRSNPFRWPALGDEEVEEMLELSTLPFVHSEGEPDQNWLDIYEMERDIPNIPGLRKILFTVSSLQFIVSLPSLRS